MSNMYSEVKVVVIIIGSIFIYTMGLYIGRNFSTTGFKTQSFVSTPQTVPLQKNEKQVTTEQKNIQGKIEQKPEQNEFKENPNPAAASEGGNPNPIPENSRLLPSDNQNRPGESYQSAPVTTQSIQQAGGCGVLPVKGKDSAPVTIIEFSDYQSTFCERFFENIFPAIEKEYINNGKVKFYHRDFPLAFHPFSESAAEASRCANEQGKFWDYHKKLYDNQSSLSSDKLKEYALEMGLDSKKFNECLESKKHAESVKKDFADGQTLGIQGLPCFFINEKMLFGVKPLENFKTIIDEELKKPTKK